MENFSLRCMRREYRGVLAVAQRSGTVFLLSTGVIGAMLLTNEEMRDAGGLIALTGLALALGFFGGYLMLSDTKWLLHHTLFGRTLTALGNADAHRARIDEEALDPVYQSEKFLLLKSWMILSQPSGCQTDPFRICFLPIPKASLRGIHLEKDADPEETGFYVRFVCDQGTYECFLCDQRDVRELHQWMEIQEIQLP